MKIVDVVIIVLYLIGMLAFGWWGQTRTRNSSDFFVAGRRLNGFFYTGTMAAVVLGGASTVGGVGLGYKFGISGMWLVVAIGLGVILLSLLFARALSRLKIYTVPQMLSLRYGSKATEASAFIMLLYTLMLTATSTQAYATVFVVVFDMPRWSAIVAGGLIVLIYSTTGGMWSITLADMAQFVIKTLGIFVLMVPFTLHAAGGWQGIQDRLGSSFTSWDSIGWSTIGTYFLTFTLGLLIGQDIWQRIFTARTPQVATWGGFTAGVYVVLYGVAGALIGTAARVVLGTDIAAKDDVYAQVATQILPMGLGALVLAAALAAMMSTASGALIAAVTVTRVDILPLLARWRGKPTPAPGGTAPDSATTSPDKATQRENLTQERIWVFIYGVLTILLAIALSDVVSALTVAYNILVGGLLVPILGGLFFKRANASGALASMLLGFVVTVGSMVVIGIRAHDWSVGINASSPILWGLLASVVALVVVSVLTPPTAPEVAANWERRVNRINRGSTRTRS